MPSTRPRASAQPTLVFIHIGKTAGMTLHQVLERQFPRRQILSLHKVSNTKLRAGHEGSDGRPPREQALGYVGQLPLDLRERVRLIEGHVIFGLHEYIPRSFTYATFLRDPVDRVLSGYQYIQRRHRHPMNEAARNMSLEELVKRGIALQFDNGQTRAIAGDTTAPFGQCPPEMLDTAKRHVAEYFSIVGITERFDESLILMRRIFNWGNVCYVRVNMSSNPLRSGDLDADTRRLIQAHNQLDSELYRWASLRFQETVDSIPGFSNDLERFRRLNSLYSPWGRVVHALPRRIRLQMRSQVEGGAAKVS